VFWFEFKELDEEHIAIANNHMWEVTSTLLFIKKNGKRITFPRFKR